MSTAETAPGMPPRDEDLVAFLRRAYQAVDGLWFMMAEEAHGLDEALRLDERVWETLAKVQARKARELLAAPGNTTEELARCFALKLTADGHDFECEVSGGGVRFTIGRCPWYELLCKSGRQPLAEEIALRICPTEARVWCAEFGGLYAPEMPRMSCCGADVCEIRFMRREAARG